MSENFNYNEINSVGGGQLIQNRHRSVIQIDRDDIEDALRGRIELYLCWLYPDIILESKKAYIGDIYGASGQSLQIDIAGHHIGRWCDFASGDCGGDLIGLYMSAHNIGANGFGKALKELSDWLGLAEVPDQMESCHKRRHKAKRRKKIDIGAPVSTYTYHSPDGIPIGEMRRHEYINHRGQSKKEFLPFDLSLKTNSMPVPRHIYNAHLMDTNRPIIFVEGEKTADAIAAAGYIGTTCMGGAMSVAHNDFSSLRGRSVFLWRDNDEAGMKWQSALIGKLNTLDIKVLGVVQIPNDKPDKWDAADADIEEIQRLISGAHKMDKEGNKRATSYIPPQPLARPPDRAGQYPVEALGPILSKGALAIQAKSQAPMAICAQSVLAVASLTAQAHVNVELPTGAVRPTSIFYLSIAASGERKSTVDNLAMRAVMKFEDELISSYNIKKPAYDAAKKLWDEKFAKAAKSNKAEDHKNIGPEPISPTLPMVTCDEPNKQGLIRALREGRPSLGVFSAEGGSFIGGNGMNRDNKMDTAASLSALWDGETIKKVRGGDGVTILPGRRVCAHLLAQAEVAREFMADPLLQDQGLVARFLIVEPESTAGTRQWKETSPETEADLDDFTRHCYQLLQRELPIDDVATGALKPKSLKLSSDAKACWIKFINAVEMDVGKGKKFEPIQAFANKAGEHAGRIAAVLSYIQNSNVDEISEANMRYGITLTNFYLSEALRIKTAGKVSQEVVIAQKVLEWLQGPRWVESQISLPDLYQLGPNSIRQKRAAMAVAKTLEDHGWLQEIEGPHKVNGKIRNKVWRIISDGSSSA